MTSQELYDLTKPLFDKHPSAKPEHYDYKYNKWCEREMWADEGEFISDNCAEISFTGYLVQWLAECDDKEGIEVVPNCGHSGDNWVIWSRFGDEVLGGGPTLLHALVAACMEVKGVQQ